MTNTDIQAHPMKPQLGVVHPGFHGDEPVQTPPRPSA